MGRICLMPAILWRAFFWGALGVATPLFGQKGPGRAAPPPLIQTGKADADEARVALEKMRQLGIAGNYYLEFQLRVMPRRGDERIIQGKLWGGRRENGAMTRVSLELPTAHAADASAGERRLLIQSGRQAAVWRWDASGGVTMLGVAALFEPVVPEADLTTFDLQMPFLYWENFDYGGLARFRGRPAHVLTLRPPTEFAAKYPKLAGVRVHLDTQFSAVVQSELLGRGDAVLKTLSVLDLKRIEEQWIVKTIDVRDEATRNKTRFAVTAAALDVEFARGLFEPAQLAESIRPPADGDITRFAP